MKFTRNLITLLALTSVTAAIAGDNRWFAGKYRPVATSSASVTDDKECKDMKDTAMSCHMSCCQGQHSHPEKA